MSTIMAFVGVKNVVLESLKGVWNKKKFQMPKSKNEEISLPVSGEGTKMATWNLEGKCQNWQKSLFFENYAK